MRLKDTIFGLAVGGSLGYAAGETMNLVNNEFIRYQNDIPSETTAAVGAVALTLAISELRKRKADSYNL